MQTFSIPRPGWLTLLLALPLLVAGCTTTKVDWSSQVGILTFDQAVIQLGPPNKQAKLTDGTVVAEWETQRGYAHTSYMGGYYGPRGYYGGYFGYYPAMPVTTYHPTYFLRLTFGPDGKLAAWKRIAL